jgi:hypothetical protein
MSKKNIHARLPTPGHENGRIDMDFHIWTLEEVEGVQSTPTLGLTRKKADSAGVQAPPIGAS